MIARRTSLAFVLSVALVVAGTAAVTANSERTDTSIPTTVQMAWVFDSQIPAADIVADEQGQNVGYVWGASAAELAGGTALHDRYSTWEQGYCPAGGLSLTCPTGGPPSYPWVKKNHPDWILWQANAKGKPTVIAHDKGDPGPILDFTNPAVQSFWASQIIAPALTAGYSGIAWDHSVPYNTYGAVGHYNTHGKFVKQYSGVADDPKYAMAQTKAYAALLAKAQAISPTASFTTSISDFCDYTNLSDWLLPIEDSKIVFDEAGYTNWGDKKYPWITATGAPSCKNRWLAQTQEFIALQKQGKYLVLDDQVPMPVTPNQTVTDPTLRAMMQWALANYLLVKYTHTYFWFGQTQTYGNEIAIQPEELINLGSAKRDMKAEGKGPNLVYVRTYSGGMAIVNPGPHNTATFTLPLNKYKTLYSEDVNSVTLGPHSGIVLETR
jgi:hypothetical protein